jgi:hypothetical protein
MRIMAIIPVERIIKSIFLIRGQKVLKALLDSDLTELYQVQTRGLIQAGIEKIIISFF